MHRFPVPGIDEINQNFAFKGLVSSSFKSFLGAMGATVLVNSQVTVLLGYLILHQSLVKPAAMQLHSSICP